MFHCIALLSSNYDEIEQCRIYDSLTQEVRDINVDLVINEMEKGVHINNLAVVKMGAYHKPIVEHTSRFEYTYMCMKALCRPVLVKNRGSKSVFTLLNIENNVVIAMNSSGEKKYFKFKELASKSKSFTNFYYIPSEDGGITGVKVTGLMDEHERIPLDVAQRMAKDNPINDKLALLGSPYRLTIKGALEINTNKYCLTKADIPKGCITIPYQTFKDCNSLVEVHIPKTCKGIGTSAFYACNNLRKLVLEEGLEVIGKHAFTYCGKLESIVLPNSIRKIQDFAFTSCKGVTYIKIPDTIEEIGFNAFVGIDISNITLDIPKRFMTNEELIRIGLMQEHKNIV